MKLNRKRDNNKSGIYCMTNKINNKKYIGKSTDIYRRIRQHINGLNKDSKDENSYLKKSWVKYGRENFEYDVLEFCEIDDLSEKELYYILKYDTINREKGYNLRLDTSSGMIPTAETRRKLSEAQKKRFEDPEERLKLSKLSKEMWKDLDLRARVSKKVSKSKQKYNFYQYSKDGEFINKFESIKSIIEKNPSYKWQNIYSVCNGYKKSYMGFIWKKELKI